MNQDIRLSVDFFGHHKVRRLRRLRGDAGVLCLIALYCYAGKHRPTGELSGMGAEDIAEAAGWEGEAQEFVAEICGLGFLEECEEGVYRIHDWAEHNPWAAGAEERRAMASKAGKASAEARRQAKAQGSGAATDGQRPVDGALQSVEPELNGSPAESNGGPTPLPSPSPKGSTLPSSETKRLLRGESVPGGAGAPPARVEDCPHEEIVGLYNAILADAGLPEVRVWGEAQRAKLRARWREDKERRSLDWWRAFFERVKAAPFLMGKVDGRGGAAPFRASLDWLVGPSNFGKVLNGNYDPQGPGRSGLDDWATGTGG